MKEESVCVLASSTEEKVFVLFRFSSLLTLASKSLTRSDNFLDDMILLQSELKTNFTVNAFSLAHTHCRLHWMNRLLKSFRPISFSAGIYNIALKTIFSDAHYQ